MFAGDVEVSIPVVVRQSWRSHEAQAIPLQYKFSTICVQNLHKMCAKHAVSAVRTSAIQLLHVGQWADIMIMKALDYILPLII